MDELGRATGATYRTAEDGLRRYRPQQRPAVCLLHLSARPGARRAPAGGRTPALQRRHLLPSHRPADPGGGQPQGPGEKRQALLDDPVKGTGAAQAIVRLWARQVSRTVEAALAVQTCGRPVVVLQGLAALTPHRQSHQLDGSHRRARASGPRHRPDRAFRAAGSRLNTHRSAAALISSLDEKTSAWSSTRRRSLRLCS